MDRTREKFGEYDDRRTHYYQARYLVVAMPRLVIDYKLSASAALTFFDVDEEADQGSFKVWYKPPMKKLGKIFTIHFSSFIPE